MNDQIRIQKCLERIKTQEQKKVLINLWTRILHRPMSKKEKILLWKFEIAFGLRRSQ